MLSQLLQHCSFWLCVWRNTLSERDVSSSPHTQEIQQQQFFQKFQQEYTPYFSKFPGFFVKGLSHLLQVHLGMMGLKVFQAQQKLEQLDKDQKQRSEAQARMSQQGATPTPTSIPAGVNQQPGESAASILNPGGFLKTPLLKHCPGPLFPCGWHSFFRMVLACS